MVGSKIFWKKTLHLPKSSFPARAVIKDRPKYLQQCTDDLYALQRSRELTQTFTLHDGPPYANGKLHLGHALNKILKDIFCRSRLPNHHVRWRPGWDCHGLPIELKALQQQGETFSSNGVGVRTAAKRLASKTIRDQKQAFRKWGIMADWDNAWTTMDKDFEIKQLHVFKEMAARGLIYRRFKPVYWSPSSRTALAEAELEYRDDHISTAAFVKFPLVSASDSLKAKMGMEFKAVSAVIWTTTPWTLPANQAAGIHEDIDYTIAKSLTHGLLLVASSRLSTIEQHLNENLNTVVSIDGKGLIGTTYADGAFNMNSARRPLLHANFVSETSGSGLVHLAPGHGKDDYELCLKHGIMAFAPVDDEGRFTSAAYCEDPQYLLGKEVLQAGNQAVLRQLSDRGQLLHKHPYTHSYPYDWRTKRPVIVRATEQWFANVGSIQRDALVALEPVEFIPSSSRTRLQTYVRNRSEWCISRQRAWGVPIPALYHVETNEPLLTEDSILHIISIIKDRGVDAWWTDEELDPAWTPPFLRDGDWMTSYRRGKDTMDVWFDSGTSWTQTEQNEAEDRHVADCYIEGTDQHRGWFQSSLLTHVASQRSLSPDENEATAPFRTLITHGFTLDQDGRKMSKSVGNVISPDEIMEGTLLPATQKKINGTLLDFQEALGPDALRLWVASCDYTTDVKVSQEVLRGNNKMLSKYRLTFRLILGLLQDFDPGSYTHPEHLRVIHEIALWRLGMVNDRVEEYLLSFEISSAVNEINRFITNDLSASYFEWIKDGAYCGTGEERLQIQSTLYQIYCRLLQMLAPITPLLIQEAWEYTPIKCRNHEKLPPGLRPWMKPNRHPASLMQLISDMPHITDARATIKGTQELARNEKRLRDSLESYACLETRSTEARELFNRYDADQLQTIFGTSGFQVVRDIANLPELAQARWAYQGRFEVRGEEVRVHVYEPQLAKCPRCWRYAAPVEEGEGETLCRRCESVIHDMRKTNPEAFE